MVVHRKGMGYEAEGCVIVETLKPFSRQSVKMMVAIGVKNDGARRFLQRTTKTYLKRSYYGGVLRGCEVVKCLVVKKLEMTSRKKLRWNALSGRMTWYDGEQ